MFRGQAAETVRAEHDAGDQEAQNGADTRAVKQRHDHAGDDQEDDQAFQAFGVKQTGFPSFLALATCSLPLSPCGRGCLSGGEAERRRVRGALIV